MIRKGTLAFFIFVCLICPIIAQAAALPADETPNQASDKAGPGVEILTPLDDSDQSFFRKTYLPEMTRQIRAMWTSLTSEAKLPQLTQRQVAVEFHLGPDGKISQMRLSRPSDNKDLDEITLEAISKASPFSVFPPEIKAGEIQLRLTFSYIPHVKAPAPGK